MQIEFENNLLKSGLSYTVIQDDFYTISKPSSGGNHIIVRLIPSLHVNEQVHGSKNGNEVQSIGLFKLKLFASRLEPDIFVFAFQNPIKSQVEFLIIPTDELLRRLVRMYTGSVRLKSVKMVIWLMEDGCVYDTTNLFPEGEWYFLSKGLNGRMADGSSIDYTQYLNSWWVIAVQ
jgi:hypothetical protein